MSRRLCPALLRMILALSAVVAALPSAARAAPADDARGYAEQGAEHFKTGRHADAAEAFERAWQIDPTDVRNLRYAGRARQEVGHLQRARLLFERYVAIEPDPALKASIQPHLEKL